MMANKLCGVENTLKSKNNTPNLKTFLISNNQSFKLMLITTNLITIVPSHYHMARTYIAPKIPITFIYFKVVV